MPSTGGDYPTSRPKMHNLLINIDNYFHVFVKVFYEVMDRIKWHV
jgi:hypothetical protein